MRRTRRSLRKKARSLRAGSALFVCAGVCGESSVGACVRGEGCAGRVVCVEADGRAGECVRRSCVKNIRGAGAWGTEGRIYAGRVRREHARRIYAGNRGGADARGRKKPAPGRHRTAEGARYDYRPGQAGPRASEGRVRVLAPQGFRRGRHRVVDLRSSTTVPGVSGSEAVGGRRCRSACSLPEILSMERSSGEETDRSDKRASRGVLPCTAVVGHEESECALPTTQPAKDRAKIAQRGGDVKREARFFHRL